MRLLIAVLFFSCGAMAAELNGVTMPETTKLGDKTLQLNGLGTRIVHRFGFPVKVYVGGLYVEKKTQDPKELIDSGQLRRIEMNFVRAVTREQVVEAWKEGFENNCFVDCEESKSKLNKEFLVKFKGLNQGQKMAVNFYKDKTEVEFPGEPVTAVAGENFTKNIVAIYFGKKFPNKELTNGMLGIAVK